MNRYWRRYETPREKAMSNLARWMLYVLCLAAYIWAMAKFAGLLP